MLLAKHAKVLESFVNLPADLQKAISNPPPHPPLHSPINFRCQRSQQLFMDGRFPLHDFRQVKELRDKDPLQLLHEIRKTQAALVAMSSNDEVSTEQKNSLDDSIHSKAIGRPFLNGYRKNQMLLHPRCLNDFERRNRKNTRTTKHLEHCNDE